VHGVSVTLAESTDAALTRLQDAEYDAVVADLSLPGHGGMWLLDAVARGWPRMQRIILSGSDLNGPELERMGVCHRFLVKPCATMDLLRALRVA